mmetsp:Transcript_8229/g.15498  ORF Transcript_8229/g.15498 Transcript_8229/m.15498 type:complete len:396 (+) Transcript_8229:22-1209(+)
MSGKGNKAIKEKTSRQNQQPTSSKPGDCDDDNNKKEAKRKEYNRIKQKRYRERVKAKAEAAAERKERKRIYNKTYREKVKAAKSINYCTFILKQRHISHQQQQREQETTTPNRRKMTSTSPMDFGSSPMSQEGPPPHNSNSFAINGPSATPGATTVFMNAGANLSRDVASSITRMQSMMADSPVVKRMSEIERPTQEQVKAYECAIQAMQEQAENEMKLHEETFQQCCNIISNASRAEEQRIKDLAKAEEEQIKASAQAEGQRIKSSAQAEEQLAMERQESREAGFAAISNMKQSMALVMLKAATPVKDTDRGANVTANVICPTPDRETLMRNARNGQNVFSQQTPATPPVFPFFSSPITDSRFQLPTGNFSIGVGSDKKPPGKTKSEAKDTYSH